MMQKIAAAVLSAVLAVTPALFPTVSPDAFQSADTESLESRLEELEKRVDELERQARSLIRTEDGKIDVTSPAYLAFREKIQQEINSWSDEYDIYEEYELSDGFAETGEAVDEGTEVYTENVMDAMLSVPNAEGFNTEEYDSVKEKGFVSVSLDPLSTFAADVDTGSYCNFRRIINEDGYYNLVNVSDSLRTEEFLNYFDYTIDEENRSDGRFSVQYETAECPWNADNELLLMTIEANQTEREYKGSNFVYLIDSSGSMDYREKIALAKGAFKLLSYCLTENDTISIVTYSGSADTILDSCPASDYDTISDALDSISTWGGTNGSGGITAAYELAEKNFIEGGNNRVIIASDGDMNLGITSESGLVDLISKEKESGIFLTVLGFGSGNYSDANMESIADAGNGNYYYIDCLDEAQHVLVENLTQTTVTAAKDVKFQAEFNPNFVSEYRLIGYENREVSDSDFENDSVDGGEVGEGQQVTVVYEIVPAEGAVTGADSGLKYQTERSVTDAADSDEILTLSVNYKEPDSDESATEEYVVKYNRPEESSADMKLAASICELTMILHESEYMGQSIITDVTALAEECSPDGNIYRNGYISLVQYLEGYIN